MAVAMIGPKFYAWDRNGKPLAFGKLYTYQARTNTPKATYRSEDQQVENTNPVILNGEGYADVYLSGSYKMVLKDDKENEIWTSDPVSAAQHEEWVNCLNAVYVSPTVFKVSGNFSDVYSEGKRVRIDNNTSEYSYSTIVSSVFSGGETTVTIFDAVVTTGIVEACVSIVGLDSLSPQRFVLNSPTLQHAITRIDVSVGSAVNVKERSEGNGGGALWDYVDLSTVTPDDVTVFQHGSVAGLALQMRNVARQYNVSTVDKLKTTDLVAGQSAKTQGYRDGWAALAVPYGAADYVITSLQSVRDTLEDQAWVPDEYGDHTLDNGYVAMLVVENRDLNAMQYGLSIEDESMDEHNSNVIDAMLAVISGGEGGVINLPSGQAFYKRSVIIDDGMSIVGVDTVSYRDDYEAESRMTFTDDVDGITYNGFNSYRNTLKNLKVDTTFEDGTSTKTGINFSSNGGAVGTRGLANILENVTVEHFKVGIHTASAGDFSWNAEFKNIKLYRCLEHLIIDGSNGVCQIDGLHIDGAGGFSPQVIGVKVLNANGYILKNYGIEGCNTGLSWQGDEDNDRMYLYSGYFENNSTSDVSFEDDSQGQLYAYGCRMAWFLANAKNQAIYGGTGAVIKASFYNLTVRGSQDGSDGLLRTTRILQSSVRIELNEYLHQASCPIWADFAPNSAPEYIKMTNQDKNSNFFELYRDTLQPQRMTAWTQRVSGTAPTNDTFVIDLPDGSTLDLKYSGATVRGKTFGAWNEWMWDGTSSFVATP